MLLKAWSPGPPASGGPTAGPWALPWELVQVARVRRAAQGLQGQPCFSISRLHCPPEPQLPTCKSGESRFSHRETTRKKAAQLPAQGQTLARPESDSREPGGAGREEGQSVSWWRQGRTQESPGRSYGAPRRRGGTGRRPLPAPGLGRALRPMGRRRPSSHFRLAVGSRHVWTAVEDGRALIRGPCRSLRESSTPRGAHKTSHEYRDWSASWDRTTATKCSQRGLGDPTSLCMAGQRPSKGSGPEDCVILPFLCFTVRPWAPLGLGFLNSKVWGGVGGGR